MMLTRINVNTEIRIAFGRSYPRAVNTDARGKCAAEAPSRARINQPNKNNLCNSYRGRRRRWLVLLGFHIELHFVVAAGIRQRGGAKLVPQHK